MKTLDELQVEIKENASQMNEHKAALTELANIDRALQIELFTLQTGLSLNDKVKFMDGKVEKTGIITKFSFKWNEICPVVTIHKAGGTLGLRTRDYWSNRSELKKA